MKPLGPGLVFTPALLPWLLEKIEESPVLEIEPQTLWQVSLAAGSAQYLVNRERINELCSLPCPKLIHSIGVPFGGTQPVDAAQVELLADIVDQTGSPWVSDHLSFNTFWDGTSWVSAGFFLPPRQDEVSIDNAITKIRNLSALLGRPIAVETGVNYLRPDASELNDGEFFAAIANGADCGILVDLQNLAVNELNGRARAKEVLAILPPEKVWEVHVSGGMQLDGYELDSHSAAVPDHVWVLAAEWLPKFPNVGALIFEILDEHVSTLGEAGLEREWTNLKRIWKKRPAGRISIALQDHHFRAGCTNANGWETVLGALVIGRQPKDAEGRLAHDPGVDLFRKLVFDTRSGFVARGLRYTTSILLHSVGREGTRKLLETYCCSRPPELFAGLESDGFANFLRDRRLSIPLLGEVLAFEHALVKASLYGEKSTVHFDHDPVVMFESLDSGNLPFDPPRVNADVAVQATR